MVALKAHEVESYLKKRGEMPRFFLVYGPDRGLVNERCAFLAKRAGANEDSLVRLSGEQVSADPALLEDEARAIGLFGGPRVIWLRADGKAVEDALENLIGNPTEATVIVEAGDLKATSPLRKLFEKSADAITLPCYADDARALGQLIDEELNAAGISIDADAKRALLENLGGDRQATRQELQKLALYALKTGHISLQDVAEVSGDMSALALDRLFDQLGLGETAHALNETQRHLMEGTHGSVLLNLALRHMLMLQVLRFDVDNGRTTSDALRTASPPIFFKRQPMIERQLVLWSLAKIDRALNLLNDAVLKTRQLPALTEALTERALMDVSLMAKARLN